ncbi:MAG: Hsp70 family protein [Treponema sp.]
MAAKIGIKLADGTFFPIMNEDFSAAETLELTTVRDDQRSVQINLFKKEEEDLSEPEYIGSLIVEDISTKAAGEPTIELRLALDDEKNLSAEAIDKDSGSHQMLRVSLETFADQSLSDLDFDLSSETDDFSFDYTDRFGGETSEITEDFSTSIFYSDDDTEDSETEKKRKVPVWLLILLILLGIGALILSILLLTKKKDSLETKTVAVHEEITTTIIEKPEQEDNPPPQPAEQPVLPPDTAMTEPPEPSDDNAALDEENAEPQEPAIKEPAASAALQKAVRYKIRWGDTLWDLSETFYRNPWLYTEIARHNRLRNPDLIISGTYIEIPPQ